MRRLLALARGLRLWVDRCRSRAVRWKLRRMNGIHVPATTYIGPGCSFTRRGGPIVLGQDSTLVSRVRLNGPVEIGNHVIIADNCLILAVNHDYERADALPYGTRYRYKPVRIEDNVWIGSNVSVAPGVTIGAGAIIGMGAVVTRDVPACAVAGGNPARVIKYRDLEHYGRLATEEKYLNDLRGYRPGAVRYVSANRQAFTRLLREQGFVLSCQMTAPEPFRSRVLFELARQSPATRFGNAGPVHIALDGERCASPEATEVAVAQVFQSCTGDAVSREQLADDLKAVCEV